MRFFLLIIWITGCFYVTPCFSQKDIYFKHIGLDEGLNHNNITALLKSKNGFLWIGTAVGLNRFDGQSIKKYEHSALNNAIISLFDGPNGNIWIRTGSGLIAFDVQKDQVLRNTDELLQNLGLPKGDILKIEEDNLGNFWFLLEKVGLFKLTKGHKKVIKFNLKSSDSAISDFDFSKEGKLWIITENGKIESQEVQLNLEERGTNFKIFVDEQNHLWIYSKNSASGVYWWSDFSKKPTYFNSHSGLNNNSVVGISQSRDAKIWIAIDNGGINLFDKKTNRFFYLVKNEFEKRSLNHNGVSHILYDSDGIIWIGTYKGGISYYHENLIQFQVKKHHSSQKNSLPYDDINRLVEDKNGNLWIGTNGGGLIFWDKKQNSFKQYLHSEKDKNSIGSNVIVSLFLDKNQNLWIGTYHGGLNLFKDGKFSRFTKESHGMSDNSVWEIYEDSQGRLWIGTLFGGVNILDRNSLTFSKPLQNLGRTSTYICAILEDKLGNIWFGTATGIEKVDKNVKSIEKIHFAIGENDNQNKDYVSDIIEDKKGRIWVATRKGLILYNSQKVFGLADGLNDETIHNLLEDNQGKIWLSTAKGVSVLSESNGNWAVRNFTTENGLQSITFNENAAVKLSNGNLIFGGPLGFNEIQTNLENGKRQVFEPKIVDFKLFNKSIAAQETVNGKVILEKSIENTQKLVLKHNQDVFSLEVASLDFLNSEQNRIRYKLENFNSDWLDLDSKSRLATFTNLSAGDYDFKVIISSDGINWSEPISLLKITINPPFWLSWLAFFIYALLFFGALLSVRFWEKRKQKNLFFLQQTQQESQRLKELDRLKTQFFTNVSHEFRTPVSLIISPLEKMVKDETNEQKKSHLLLVHRNAKRLLNLVNQLLDFRKVDTESLKVDLKEGDLIQHIRENAIAFSDLAESKNIDFKISLPKEPIFCAFDFDKMERIVFNLLSNAFKFTPVSGKVEISAKFEKELILKVKDNGIGISDALQNKVFERYFQTEGPSSILNQGSGIGLAITKAYVEILGGKIAIESAENQGSEFTISMPINLDLKQNLGIKNTSKFVNRGGRKVLIVEDNEDFRFYLSENLREVYNVEQAKDFNEAWDKILSFHPDLIVSDVSMPGKTGIDLCEKVKSDSRTQHIPFILLTALTTENHQLKGIEAGASDYIIKPFNVDLLLSKIKSQLNQKDSFEKTFKKQIDVNPSDLNLESTDEKFLRKALEKVEKNISNPNFSVEAMADLLNLSRVGLYKKVFALNGISPTEFIRNIRLKRANQLLLESNMTIAEVAYEVGFNNPKAFSKYYKEFYGVLPSEHRKKPSK